MSKKEESVKTELLKVVLNLGVAESIGIHTVFAGNKLVNFLDGTAMVTASQADELRENGYIE